VTTVPFRFKSRGYLHFDLPLSAAAAEVLTCSPEKVARHSFYPFLGYTATTEKIQKEDDGTITRTKKEREIKVAAHRDAAIYARYGDLLTQPYEAELKTRGIGKAVTAFRSNGGGTNIDFAGEVFEYIDHHRPCVALAYDLKNFFDTLDHDLLKQRWAALLGVARLPADHFAIFRSLTNFSWVEQGCDINDVLPWRYWRGMSLLMRPFVEVSRSPRRFVISAPHLHRWRTYLTNAILEGYLPDKLFHSSTMKSYFGSVANKKGHKFTDKVGVALNPTFPDLKLEIKMTELGAPAQPDLGDVDVLAWNKQSGVVLIIECKRLKSALTIRQSMQQLDEFKGGTGDEDYLAKHQRRVEWLMSNPGEISRITGIQEAHISWVPLLITSGRVPMSFIDAIDFPKEQVIPFIELEQRLREIGLQNGRAFDPDANPLESPASILPGAL
jgi:hypothetical protein